MKTIKLLLSLFAIFGIVRSASGQIVGPIPNNLTNGTTIDAVPVMANYNWIMNQVNAKGAPLASPTFTGTVTGGAGGFVGNLVGNASTCTAAGITNDTTTNATMYPVWVTGNTGTLPVKTTSTKLTWNPSTGSLGATTFVGALTGNVTGNASTATTATNFNNGTSSSSGGTVTATTLAGTLSTAAQPNITSTGALTPGGNITLGTNHLSYGGTAAGLSFDSSNNATLSGSLTAGAISGTSAAISSTSVGTLLSVAVTGGFGAGSIQGTVTNAGGALAWGVARNDGLVPWTTTAYAGFIGTTNATNFSVGVNNAQIGLFSSTGLAVTGTTSSTAFSGPLTGNVTGNVSGTAATVTGAAQSAITSVGTLTGLSSSSYKDGAGNLIISSTAPTIASGFGTSPSILANNTAAFKVTVGSGGTANMGTLTMPAATNGWACTAQDISQANFGYMTKQYATSTTSVSVQNNNQATSSLVAWGAGDVLLFQCAAF